MDELGELRRRVEDLTDAVQALLDAQDTAGAPTGNGDEVDETDTEPARRWADRATNDDWVDLVGWVDRLTVDYAIRSEFHVPPCWPAHAGVVEEFAALHRAWISSALADDDAGTAGAVQLAVWHDQWLWPVLRRIKDGHYDITNCRGQGHARFPSPAAKTDMAFLPATLNPGIRPRP